MVLYQASDRNIGREVPHGAVKIGLRGHLWIALWIEYCFEQRVVKNRQKAGPYQRREANVQSEGKPLIVRRKERLNFKHRQD
jgi:hypothetical protein